MNAKHNPTRSELDILIADDSPTQIAKLAFILEQNGYQIEQAKDGQEVLDLLGDYQPALVISDIVMPRLNGYELCRRIKANHATQQIPVILLTSLSDNTDVLEGLACGADSFLTKPYTAEYLLKHVKNILTNGSAPSETHAEIQLDIGDAGERKFISVDPQRLLSLLLSTYEAAMSRNAELIQTQSALNSLNSQLEDLVQQRTAALSSEITQRKQAEEILARKVEELSHLNTRLERHNRDLQEFAHVAAHDLQEPLRKVRAFGERLANKYTQVLDAKGQYYLARMQAASHRMQNMVNDLLAFSQISAYGKTFTEVDLRKILTKVLSELEEQIEQENARVEIGELPVIQADAAQIAQLMRNLVDNALKFRHKERNPFIKIRGKLVNDVCQVKVEDNGIGFEIQYLDRIFKPFQRLHYQEDYAGSGMGLALCRRIVERHNGTITATSTLSAGSTFIVNLPLKQN